MPKQRLLWWSQWTTEAPWHKYPSPLEACYDAVLWAAATASELGADADRLMVIGGSTGGNLAAAAYLMARDQDAPSRHHQRLIFPAPGRSGADQVQITP